MGRYGLGCAGRVELEYLIMKVKRALLRGLAWNEAMPISSTVHNLQSSREPYHLDLPNAKHLP